MSLKTKPRRFVVQQHKARQTHWDFRLQENDKMKSWILPKGPSLNPSVKSFAIETSDHDLKYGNFEGIIDVGLYGAGKVLQWDRGTYRILEGNLNSDIIKFELNGKKLKGKWALVKTKRGWLLIKQKDEHATTSNIVRTAPKSVKSGKKIDDITKRDGFIVKEKDLGWD